MATVPILTKAGTRHRVFTAGETLPAANIPPLPYQPVGNYAANLKQVRTGAGAYSLLATDDVVVNTGGAATWTLPLATAANKGKVYSLVNQGTANLTFNQPVRTTSSATVTTLAFGATTSCLQIVSDGAQWRKFSGA